METQPVLFGNAPLLALGDSEIEVRVIFKEAADEIIKAGHYSRSVVWSSSDHFGVYSTEDERLLGAIQFGPAMNPASGGSIVRGTEPEQWIELNRMWLSDEKPPNTATRAISFSIRLLRRSRPELKWIQSFADSRCGKAGAVYQAASFVYCGSHRSVFYELDGEWFHKSMLDRPEIDKRGWWSGPKIARLREGRSRATRHEFRQYRYIRFLDRRWRGRLLLRELPYPKP